ncbi:hypothetical protein HNY73_008192 [Argiope bruennichi]|uniref:Uncharacterized protein n=1 Tax=Argiope bruennichi TaxID=94029 RepID=A0A8T0F5K6_ARGBR|nr:hypothetical protein HNY73_008192 [Argiope bruennichi]
MTQGTGQQVTGNEDCEGGGQWGERGWKSGVVSETEEVNASMQQGSRCVGGSDEVGGKKTMSKRKRTKPTEEGDESIATDLYKM